MTKIGFVSQDVTKDLFEQQKELSEITLRAEIDEYKPSVVHFAVGTLGGECIYRATGTTRADWHTLEAPFQDIWFLNADTLKAIWTRHPNRARKEFVQAWSDKLRDLLN